MTHRPSSSDVRRQSSGQRLLGGLPCTILLGHALGFFAACSQPPRERPPYADQSCVANCAPAAAMGGAGGGAAGTDEEDTSSGTVTPTDTDGGGSLTVELDVQEATDLERTTGASLGSPFAVYSWSDPDERLGRSNGNEPLVVEMNSQTEWLLVEAQDEQGDPAPAWLSTLTWQRPVMDPVVVPLFSSATWSGWAAGLALTPSSLDPAKGHLLLQVLDASGSGRAGVSAEATSGAIAYAAGGTASDVLAETDTSGIVVWFNAPVGSGTALTLLAEADEWSVAVPTRAGTVSVVAVTR